MVFKARAGNVARDNADAKGSHDAEGVQSATGSALELCSKTDTPYPLPALPLASIRPPPQPPPHPETARGPDAPSQCGALNGIPREPPLEAPRASGRSSAHVTALPQSSAETKQLRLGCKTTPERAGKLSPTPSLPTDTWRIKRESLPAAAPRKGMHTSGVRWRHGADAGPTHTRPVLTRCRISAEHQMR